MDIVPKDPALLQYVSAEEFQQMGATFSALAEGGKSLTRLPRKQVDRQRVLEAIHEAFELVGGVPRMALWAHENYGDFIKLYAKTAPSALQVSGGLVHGFVRPSLPPSPLDQEFTDNDFVEPDSGAGVQAEDSVPALPSASPAVRRDGGSSSSR